MISSKERTAKIREASCATCKHCKKLTAEQRAKRLHDAVHHDKDAGLSSTDEYVFLKHKATEGR